MAEQFKAGDVVQLKSGGPKMTIREIENWDGGPRAWCKWFHGNDSKEDVFPLVALKFPEAPNPSSFSPAKTGAWS